RAARAALTSAGVHIYLPDASFVGGRRRPDRINCCNVPGGIPSSFATSMLIRVIFFLLARPGAPAEGHGFALCQAGEPLEHERFAGALGLAQEVGQQVGWVDDVPGWDAVIDGGGFLRLHETREAPGRGPTTVAAPDQAPRRNSGGGRVSCRYLPRDWSP